MKATSLLLCAAALLAACQNTATTRQDQTATTVEAAARGTHDRPGFTTFEKEGRLWVFCDEDPTLAEYRQSGDLVKRFTRIGAGPGGMTVLAPDAETIDAYVLARPGFVTRCVDGRIWVFAAGSADFAEFCASGEPAKCVTLIGAGPNGETVRSSDAAVVEAWKQALDQ